MVICPGSPWAGGLGCRWGAGLGNGPKVLCPFPGAGVTKHRRLGGLDPELHLLPVLEAGSPDPGVARVRSSLVQAPLQLLAVCWSPSALSIAWMSAFVSMWCLLLFRSLCLKTSFFFLIRTCIRFRPVQLQPDLIQSVSSAATLFPNKFTF